MGSDGNRRRCCGVILDIRLEGFRYWNVDDLEPAPKRKKT